jgi:hypothetical protein
MKLNGKQKCQLKYAESVFKRNELISSMKIVRESLSIKLNNEIFIFSINESFNVADCYYNINKKNYSFYSSTNHLDHIEFMNFLIDNLNFDNIERLHIFSKEFSGIELNKLKEIQLTRLNLENF